VNHSCWCLGRRPSQTVTHCTRKDDSTTTTLSSMVGELTMLLGTTCIHIIEPRQSGATSPFWKGVGVTGESIDEREIDPPIRKPSCS
jgi:hypothetical protein